MAHVRGSMKEGGNVTILLLGDDGVGKSSLASTFVSRHFSEKIPGVLTRVRLPPDPSLSKCTTTIIDTQDGEKALRNALSLSIYPSNASISSIRRSHSDGEGVVVAKETDSISPGNLHEDRRNSSITSCSKYDSVATNLATTSLFRNVDAIILVYDLDRIETFHRMGEDWLPLIAECYNGDLPVIVAGNKLDLASAPENSPTRQQIITLLQQYKSVRQCIKCSAKKLVNIDEVFLKAQQSVLYPITPLYDLNIGKLSPACSRAFTRIFRMYMDNDGLLSDAGLNAFQQKIWGVSLGEKDFTGWKKMATQHDGSGVSKVEKGDILRDGKFTLAGFLTIFDVLITSQNRLEVPWKVLRVLGYDDDLNLNIPASISPLGGKELGCDSLHPDDWRLTSSDIDYLTSTFLQFDSDGDGTLSSTDIQTIFSVLSCPHPPWSELGTSLLFQDCFSLPRIGDEETPPASSEDAVPSEPVSSDSSSTSDQSSPSSRISVSGITISSSPLPSIDMSEDSESICFSPPTNYQPLSFLSWISRWHMICTISPSIARAEMYKLGRNFERKSPTSLNNLGRVDQVASNVAPSVSMPSTFIRALILGSKDSGKNCLVKKLHSFQHGDGEENEIEHPTSSCSVSKLILPSSSTTAQQGEETLVHVILTEVPALDMSSDAEKENLRNNLAIFLGQKSGKRPYDMAMLVFDVKNRQSFEVVKELERSVMTEDMPRVYIGTTSGSESSCNEADEYCQCMDLEPPLFVSLCEETALDPSVLERLVSCAQNNDPGLISFRSTPHGERKRRSAANRRKFLWFGGIVTAGISVVLLSGKRKMISDKSGWFQFLKSMIPF